MTKNIHKDYHESHWRSIVKAITWRVIASITTFTITYFVYLHNAKAEIPTDIIDQALREEIRQQAKNDAIKSAMYIAGSVMVIELFSKLFLYYLHERVWQSVNAGWIKKYNRTRRINKIRKKRLKGNN